MDIYKELSQSSHVFAVPGSVPYGLVIYNLLSALQKPSPPETWSSTIKKIYIIIIWNKHSFVLHMYDNLNNSFNINYIQNILCCILRHHLNASYALY